MKKATKWIGNLLIAIGLASLVILLAGVKNNADQQNELMKAFVALKTEASDKTDDIEQFQIPEKLEAANIPEDMNGILSIPAIELKAPVLEGATPDNLNKALGAISGLDKPGVMNGSYAIAGHQSHIFGKFFNRLNELEKGDIFIFETAEETFRFQVFAIEIVNPEEVEVLEPQEGMAMLSLVTCYPENSNKYRLVVQAKLIEKI